MSRRTDALPLRPRIAERPEIVFFDVGDTLLRVDPSWTGAYLAAAHSWGLDVSEGALAAAFAQALGEGLWDSFGPFDATPESSYQRIKQFDVRAMALLGYDDLPDGFYRHLGRFFERRGAWHVFPDAHPALLALGRAGFRRAVISNWVWALPELLHDLELAHHFEAIVASARVGFVKPQPQIFEHALELTGVRPGAAIHVGDNPDADVAGASAAGIRPVLLDRTGRLRDGLPGRPDVPVVSDLLALLPLLGCEPVARDEPRPRRRTERAAAQAPGPAGDRRGGATGTNDLIARAIRETTPAGSSTPSDQRPGSAVTPLVFGPADVPPGGSEDS